MRESIICIGREYGSGGKEIGEKLADRINIPCYDKFLIKKATGKGDISYSAMEHMDEKLPRMTMSGNAFADTAIMMHNFYFNDGQTAHSVCETMKEFSSRQSYVIIGRYASVFFKNYSILLVFIYANYDDCVQRIIKRNAVFREEAKSRHKQIDRLRRQYFDFYLDIKWGKTESYDIMMSSSALGIEGCVEMIEKGMNFKMGGLHHE